MLAAKRLLSLLVLFFHFLFSHWLFLSFVWNSLLHLIFRLSWFAEEFFIVFDLLWMSALRFNWFLSLWPFTFFSRKCFLPNKWLMNLFSALVLLLCFDSCLIGNLLISSVVFCLFFITTTRNTIRPQTCIAFLYFLLLTFMAELRSRPWLFSIMVFLPFLYWWLLFQLFDIILFLFLFLTFGSLLLIWSLLGRNDNLLFFLFLS